MKITKGQWLFAVGVLLVNALVWAIPSNVVELVARDRQTLLGRYSREHFAWIIGLVPVSGVAIYLHLSPSNAVKKIKAFRVAAVLLAVFPALFAFDIYLRLATKYAYVLDGLAYRRPPRARFEGVFEDVPEAIRTYPHIPPGYGRVAWTMTTDARGFRNQADVDQCDVLVLGDSFAEGSKVSDEHAWPRRLGELTGLTVYNLGMSGYAPHHYLASLKTYGLALRPKTVLCLFYEGNDFDNAERRTAAPPEWSRFFKRSPIVQAIDDVLIRGLGPIGATREIESLSMLSWLPLSIPPDPDARYYSFPPSFLENHYITRQEFENGKDWDRTRYNLEQMLTLCRQAGAEFVLVYAPTKPRVLLPLVRDRLPADKVRAFMALRFDDELPEPQEFMDTLFADLDVKEQAVQDWCRENAVSFLSLTEPLRARSAAGQPVFYSYNEHWSPVGHEAVAEIVADYWSSHHPPSLATEGKSALECGGRLPPPDAQTIPVGAAEH